MANAFFQFGMQQFAQGAVAWKASGGSNIRCALVDATDYTVDLAAHDFLDHVAAGAREETSANMTLVDAALDGVLDANDVVFAGTNGDACDDIILYKFVTGDADSPLLLWWDTVTGMPVTLGGDVTVVWPSGTDKIAKI